MRYVLVMLGSLVGLVIVAYLLLYLLISVGCIYPANYAEQKINEAYDTILRAAARSARQTVPAPTPGRRPFPGWARLIKTRNSSDNTPQIHCAPG